MTVLSLDQVYKNHKGKRLLKQINIKIGAGEIFALVGSDHSRKSLLIKIILGLVKPTGGKIEFFGQSLVRGSHQHLMNVGAAIDGIGFYEALSGYDNIRIFLEPYKRKFQNQKLTIDQRIEKYFRMFHLSSEMHNHVKNYSLGMKQKLRLIRVFAIEPDLMILDDPAKTLDPVIIKVLKRELKRRVEEENTAVFIATSMLHLIEDIADQISVMHYGELIEGIRTDELQANQQAFLSLKSNNLPHVLMVIERELQIFDYEVMDDQTVYILESKTSSSKIIKTLHENEGEILEVKYGFNSLEAYFLDMIGD